MITRSAPIKFIASVLVLAFVSGCASGKIKQRQEVREKLSQSSGYFCGFVNGESFPDMEVQLNIEIAKSCQAGEPFTITNYKNPQDLTGVLFCCNIREGSGNVSAKSAKRSEKKADAIEAPAVTEPAPAAPLEKK